MNQQLGRDFGSCPCGGQIKEFTETVGGREKKYLRCNSCHISSGETRSSEVERRVLRPLVVDGLLAGERSLW